ncbi:MAG: hypothetical protein WB579_14785 [Bryobacteraceae bacterium]
MKLARRLIFWGIAGVLCLSSVAIAEVQMTLTGVGTGSVMGGVYISPYVASIGGVPTYVICDDFTTDVWVGDTWEANQNSLSDVGPSGPQKFTTPDWYYYTTQPVYYTMQQEYDAAALLAEELMANMGNPTLAGEYSYAIWTMFDPAAINGYGASTLTGAQQTAVNTFRAEALANAFNGEASGLEVSIYTPAKGYTSQEFLVVSTPEASLPATLAVELSALAGVILLMRRRLARRGAPR